MTVPGGIKSNPLPAIPAIQVVHAEADQVRIRRQKRTGVRGKYAGRRSINRGGFGKSGTCKE
jgi:hypothetical protein